MQTTEGLRVEVALLEHEEIVLRDTLVMTPELRRRVYDIAAGPETRRYVFSYTLSGGGASFAIQTPLFGTGFARAASRSDGWESVELGDESELMFKLTPLSEG